MRVLTDIEPSGPGEVRGYYWTGHATLVECVLELYERQGMRSVHIAELLHVELTTVCHTVRRLRLDGRITVKNTRARKAA